MTQAKRWPNNAENARMNAIAQAQEGLRALNPVIDEERMTQTEMLRRIGVGIRALYKIISTLKEVGPGA